MVLTETLVSPQRGEPGGTLHAGVCTGISSAVGEPWDSRNSCVEMQKVLQTGAPKACVLCFHNSQSQQLRFRNI